MSSRAIYPLMACVAVVGLALVLAGMAHGEYVIPPGQTGREGLLIPVGGGHPDIYAGFAAAAVANAKNSAVKIIVLPIGYASDPQAIAEDERAGHLETAESRRLEIEQACQRAAPLGVTCRAILDPILVRSDALDPAALIAFNDELAAIWLDGDPAVAMQVISGTLVESALSNAYQRGVVIAGGGELGVTMLGGYNPGFAASNALNFGAADVWNTAERRGLPFGIKGAIVESGVIEQGHMGRLLNAIALPGVPHVGVGLDAGTGVQVPGGARLENVFGLYSVAVLDAETYHAADAVQYRGPNHTLSLRNVLVHMLAPGKFSYDLARRQHSLGAPAATLKRTFELALPKGAGVLILAGGLGESLDNNSILAHFVRLAGEKQANILVLAAGYSSDQAAQAAAASYAAALGVQARTIVVSETASASPALPGDATGIVFIAQDPSRLQLERLAPLKEAWLEGKPVLADGAAAAAMGAFFRPEEAAVSPLFLKGQAAVQPGLRWVNLALESGVLSQNRWGRLFSLAYEQPGVVAVGLADGTALELTGGGTSVLGKNVVVTLDLRTAKLRLGANNSYVIANGLLDVFAAGDAVKPEPADVKAAPARAATPVVVISTATPLPTPTVEPSSTPVPTPTPLPPTPTLTPGPTVTPVPAPGAGGVDWVGWGVLGLAVVGLGGVLLLRSRRPSG